MILISKIQLNNKIFFPTVVILAICLFFISFLPAKAQTAQSLSVSPTLFEMSANPEQEWSSSIRIINPNQHKIKVFANVVNFAPKGESGQGQFLPILDEETKKDTIAGWVNITKKAIEVEAEQTIEIPFSVKVPETAPPGGHFAAILIGTKPPEDPDRSIQVQTSQIVTSLLFLRVEGDVLEEGSIRSFRTTDSLYEKPEVNFELRFENKGNVHLQPQGEIEILNMWGQVRGIIPVNKGTMFGNVLPESVREFAFTWTGDWSIADMGRYTAVATLGYGDNGTKFVHSDTAFWVIPWKIFLSVIIILFSLIYFLSWAIKLYIRRMLSMAGVAPENLNGTIKPTSKNNDVSVAAPIEAGMLDLRAKWQETATMKDKAGTIRHMMAKYWIFLVGILAFVFLLILLVLYFKSAFVSERAYDITIDGLSDEVSISSEEIKYQEKAQSQNSPNQLENTISTTSPKITIVNRSGISGLAVDLRLALEEKGYNIKEIKNDFGVAENNTVIVYDPKYTAEASELSSDLFGALLSAFYGEPESGTPITIYVGKDLDKAMEQLN